MINLFDIMARKSTSKVLRYFLANPTKETYAAKLVKVLRMAKGSVFVALYDLENAGLLKRAQVGKTILYSFARDSAVGKQLKILLAVSCVSGILKKLHNLDPEAEAYLFGSAARGESTEKSDLDVLVISSMPPSLFSPVFAEHVGVNIKPVFYNRVDYAQLFRRDPAFYERIEKDRIRLV